VTAGITREIAHNKRMAGRPRAVTPELLAEGRRMLASGMTILVMCDRLGVHHRSWYRAANPNPPRQSKRPRRKKRQGLTRAVVKAILRLRSQGLTLAAIAERLGIHLNTVHKHAQRARRLTPPPSLGPSRAP